MISPSGCSWVINANPRGNLLGRPDTPHTLHFSPSLKTWHTDGTGPNKKIRGTVLHIYGMIPYTPAYSVTHTPEYILPSTE